MKICVFSAIALKHCFNSIRTRRLLSFLLLINLAISSTIFSQTTPVVFTPIPYSDPDIISPGRGAEQWDNGLEGINNPTADSNQRSLDVYYRFSWSKMEGDSLGSYNWTQFDGLIEQAIDHRQKMSFGIMPVYDGIGTVEYDGARSAYPLYLHKLMQADKATSRDWISHGVWIPNWNSSHYISRLRALHDALNQHILSSSYKGVAYKDAILSIDIRGYGNYGEWHNAGIVDHLHEYPSGAKPSAYILKKIIAQHTEVFKLWPLTLMIAAFDAEQFDAMMIPPEVTYYALTTKNAWGPLGWRRDQWGATDGYLDKLLKNNEKKYSTSPAFKEWITTRYLTSPVTGEPPRYVNEGGPCQLWDLERQIIDYGASSFGNGNWGVYLSECGMQNARAAFKRAGYRIILQGGSISSTIAPGKPLSITLQWKNIGIAPTYENWDVIYELKNDSNVTVWSGTSKFKPKRFAPADTATNITDTFTLPANITIGSYKLNVIIKDPAGYRAPFPLAINGRNPDGSYTIRNINASPVNCVPPVARISHSPGCNGQAFNLILDSASGRSPYNLVINGTTYTNVAIGQTITTINSPLQKIFAGNPVPKNYEDSPVELGVKFKSSVAGYIKGIRFFSSNSPAGKYTGHLWTVSGTLLDSAEFTAVTASGWQEVLFANPILIKADSIYVASYHSTRGHYAATPSGLGSSVTAGTLTALGNGVSGVNGLYSYGNSPTFPTGSFNATNYWVDVLFTPNTYTFNFTSITDSTGCNNSGSLQTIIVNADSCATIPVPPVLPTASIKNSAFCNGQAFNLYLDSATGPGPYDLVINGAIYNNIRTGQTITTVSPDTTTQKIWDTIPSPKSFEDSPVELGVKFTSSAPGFIKGIRFFSAAMPSGKYAGHLWTSTGTLLDSVVFTGVTANGWQEALFATPLPVLANTTYVASYHTASGHYVATPAGLTNAVTNGPLTALDNVTAGGNGLYGYGANPTFPANSFNAANYWVDVIFTNNTVNSYTFNLTSVTDSTGLTNDGALQTLLVTAGNCDTSTVPPPPVVLPTASIGNSDFCNGQAFSIYLDSATGPGPYDLVINGTTYHDIQIGETITTVSPAAAIQKIWDTIPSPNSFEDSPVELGVKFRSSLPGFIKGIRFFSPAMPSGKYTGHLWTSTGILLDSVIFTGVTANGWQEALFATPLAVLANTTYIASYHTASGRYVATPAGLVNAVTNGPLTVLDNITAGGNGLYGYGANPTFPANSFNAANYWVDVMFSNNTVNNYTFNLTSVTDSTGKTKNGSLQTLAVTSTDCAHGLRSSATPPATNLSTKLSPVTKRSPIQKGEIKTYLLSQNYPNPFRNETRIQYSLPIASRVNLSLFDMNGRLIKVIVNGSREQGTHTVSFNSGMLGSGLYFYKIQAGNFSAVKKMIIQ